MDTRLALPALIGMTMYQNCRISNRDSASLEGGGNE
jgi:hypothetical protein